jgi:hypothetical protein
LIDNEIEDVGGSLNNLEREKPDLFYELYPPCPAASVVFEAFRSADFFGWKLLDLPTACSFASVCKFSKSRAPEPKELRNLCVSPLSVRLTPDGFNRAQRHYNRYMQECGLLDYPALMKGISKFRL